jgi:hypothetical protein
MQLYACSPNSSIAHAHTLGVRPYAIRPYQYAHISPYPYPYPRPSPRALRPFPFSLPTKNKNIKYFFAFSQKAIINHSMYGKDEESPCRAKTPPPDSAGAKQLQTIRLFFQIELSVVAVQR